MSARRALRFCGGREEAAPRAEIVDAHGHDAHRVRAIASGRDVVVISGTASGKVLIYQLPASDDWAARRARAPSERRGGSVSLLVRPRFTFGVVRAACSCRGWF